MPPNNNYGYQQPVYSPVSNPNGRKQRVAIIVLIVAVVLLIMLWVANSFSNATPPSERYGKLTAEHSEMLRIINANSDKTQSRDTQNYMARARILLITGEDSLQDLLAKQFGESVTAEQKAAAKDREIDDQLKSSARANRFDEDFEDLFAPKVESVLLQAQANRDSTNNETIKKVMNEVIAIYESL